MKTETEDNKNKIDNLMICTNWWPLIADKVIDYPQSFYDGWGVVRLHNEELFTPDNTSQLQPNDIIFAKTDFIIHEQFQNEWLDKINVPFNLLTSLSSYQIGRDGNNPESYKKIVENEYLQNWFCTNAPTEPNEKIHALPIGFSEPNRLSANQNILRRIRKSAKPFEDKIDRLFIPWHTSTTNVERGKTINRLKRYECTDMMQNKLSIEPYLNLMGEYRYTICIQGTGNDTHRLYESLLVGCVPITINCSVQRVFDEYNLPGHFVESWDDVDEEFFDRISKQNYDFSSVEDFLQAKTHADKIKRICEENNEN